jgi:ketosteroid isomerase-like protein
VSSEEEENMALVRRFQEAEAKGDLDMLDELLAPEFVEHSLLEGQEPGREGYKRQLAEQHAALSEVRCIIEDQLAKGEKVATRFTLRSIHDRGEYRGLPQGHGGRGDGYYLSPHSGGQDRRGVERGERFGGDSAGPSRARGARARARRAGAISGQAHSASLAA